MMAMQNKAWAFLMFDLSMLNVLSSPPLGTAAIQETQNSCQE